MLGNFPEDVLKAFYDAYSEKENLECNKPKMEHHGNKKAVVKACYPGAPEGGKLIRFGDANMTTAGAPKENESDEKKARRASFKARHAKNIAHGPQSGAYWANKFLW
jgi:hypothetical protein